MSVAAPRLRQSSDPARASRSSEWEVQNKNVLGELEDELMPGIREESAVFLD